MKRFGLIFLFALFLAVGWVGKASAQKPTPSDDEVNAIARQLYCPICENIPLEVCPTQACHDWRELIRQMLAEGKTPDQIKQYFVDHYGARVLPEPPAKGFNLMLYIVPAVYIIALVSVVVILVIMVVLWYIRRRAKPVTANPPPIPQDLDDQYVARLEDELRKRH